MIIKVTGGLGSWRTSGDHPNYCIIENGKNTKNSPGELRRLAVTQTPVKDHQLKLMWKTLMGNVLVFNRNHFEMRLLIWELIFNYCGLFPLILVVFVLFLLSLRFGHITWRRTEVKCGRNVVKEETTQNYQDEGEKSAINKNWFSV